MVKKIPEAEKKIELNDNITQPVKICGIHL